jgi:hypothetical protein
LIRKILGALVVLLLTTQSCFAENVSFFVNLVLQGSISDAVTGNGKDFAEMIRPLVENHYPSTHYIPIEATTPDDLNHKLAQHMDASTVVDALVVISHGASNLVSGEIYSTISDGDSMSRFSLFINLEDHVKKAFGPIIGRFHANSNIVFMSCALLEAGNFAQKAAALKKVAANFGLNYGTVFMNETNADFYSKTIAQPTDHQSLSHDQAENHMRMQIVTPLMIGTIGVVLDRYIDNQGYRYQMSAAAKSGEKRITIARDYLFNAIGSSLYPEDHIIIDRLESAD